MENHKTSEVPTPNTNPYSPGDSISVVPNPESPDVDYRVMAKIIDKQLAKFNRTYVKELQKKFKRFIKDNQANFDRLSSENGRLLKIVEDLQSSQRHLQHQLELHQEREKLAVLREQQDVKRIRDLEDRLSLFLLAPVENQQITLDDSIQSEIAIQPAEIVETIEEVIDGSVDEGEMEDIKDVVDQQSSGEEKLLPDPLDTMTVKEDRDTVSLFETNTSREIYRDPIVSEDDNESVADEDLGTPDSDLEDSKDISQQFDGDHPLHTLEEESVKRDHLAGDPVPLGKIEDENDAELVAVEPSSEIDDPGKTLELLVEETIDQNPRNELEVGETDIKQADGDEDHSDNEPVESLIDVEVSIEDSPFTVDITSIPLTDERIQADSSQNVIMPNDYDIINRNDDAGSVAEPSTEEIETVGEMPPLGLDSTPGYLTESEINSAPNDEVIETSYNDLLYEPEDTFAPSQESLTENTGEAAESGFEAIDSENRQEDGIIELQDEISISGPDVGMESTGETPEEIGLDGEIEMPGMLLEAVAEEVQDDTAQIDPSKNMEGEIPASDDDTDTGSFEIIELQEENIISPSTNAADNLQAMESQSPVLGESTDTVYPESPSDPPFNPFIEEETAVDITPDNAQKYFNRGKSACETKDYAQAAVYFDRFVELVPDEPRGHYNLAILYYRLKKYPVALTHAKQALALDYTLAKKILRKIEFKLASDDETSERLDQVIEDTSSDEPITLNEVVNGVTSSPIEDETVVYEPDILPDFNIDLAEHDIADETGDKPYDLLSPVEDESSESGFPDVESPGERLDTIIAKSSVESSEPEKSEQGIEQPGMENTDDVSPEGFTPMAEPAFQAIEAESPIADTARTDEDNVADELPGMALVDDSLPSGGSNKETFSRSLLSDQGAEEMLPNPEGMAEELPADTPEAIEEIDQAEQETSGNDTSNDALSGFIDMEAEQPVDSTGHSHTDNHNNLAPRDERTSIPDAAAIEYANESMPQDAQAPVDGHVTVVAPARMDEQEENLFNAHPDYPEKLLPDANEIPQEYTSEADPGEDTVESSEEAIPANLCFSEAMKASQNKDYPEAIARFEKYIDQLPDEPKGHYNLAILHYRMQEYDKASEYANRALQLGAKSSKKIIDKIESKRSQISSDERQESGEEALSNLLNDSLNFPTTGLDRPAAGDDETASIWDADELDGDISQSLITEAANDDSFGAKDDVIVFNSAVAPEKQSAMPKEKPSEDKPSLDELKISAIRHSSLQNSEEPNVNDEDILGHDGSDKVASSENGRVKNLFKLGEKAIESNEFLKAIKHFTKVTHLAPEDPRGYYYLAMVSCRLKFFETAREHATRAIEMGSEPAKKVLEEINAHQKPT